MYGQITQIESYDFELVPMQQKKDRTDYLKKMIFYTNNPAANPLSDRNIDEVFSTTSIAVKNQRDEFYSILEEWGDYQYSFTEEMMQKYTPVYKGYASPFKNVGHPSLKRLESKFDPHNKKYFGLSHGRTLQEFISDAKNPLNRVSINVLTEEEAVNRGLLPGRQETPESVPAEPILDEQVIPVDIPKNMPAQTEPIGIAEKEIQLQLDEPLETQQTSYFLIGMVAVLIVSLGFLLRGKK